MKVVIKYFWPFSRFRIEGRKPQNSDFQNHFPLSKIFRIHLNFFSLKNINNGENLLLFSYFDNFDLNVVEFLKEGLIFDLQF